MSPASFQHFARRTAAPAAAYLLSVSSQALCRHASKSDSLSLCEGEHTQGAPSVARLSEPTATVTNEDGSKEDSGEPLFHGLFPQRQLFRPQIEWPLWNYNWDGRQPPFTSDAKADKRRERVLRKTGVTRHIILIRHGQYDETHSEDEKQILTPLGREQADLTGQRLAEMAKGVNKEFGPCQIRVVRVSDMARAKETADIICRHLPNVPRAGPDPLLNEGRPCHNIPCGSATLAGLREIDQSHPRIESAFQKYFYRADEPSKEAKEEENDGPAEPQPQESIGSSGEDDSLKPHPKHEFEIIVCHGNVIRYFTCRALQIPPEAWLRFSTFNCSLTYLTIRPTGSVSCRMLGDIGHLGLAKSTFSSRHGFNW